MSRYTIEQINMALGREDVARFLDERRQCMGCEKKLPVVRDAHAIKLLHMAVTDPEGERGGNLDLYGRSPGHIQDFNYVDKHGAERTCYQDREFKRRIDPKKKKYYDSSLAEFYDLIKTGEIVKGENGRWNLTEIIT